MQELGPSRDPFRPCRASAFRLFTAAGAVVGRSCEKLYRKMENLVLKRARITREKDSGKSSTLLHHEETS
jgi:hypothetical protein